MAMKKLRILFLCNGKRRQVGFDDPPKLAKKLGSDKEIQNCYRRVRDEIKAFVLTLPDSLKHRGGTDE